MGSGCRRKSGGSLFHPKVRWGEDSIFDAPAGIGGEPCPAGGVEGVHCFHQANGADGDQVLLITRQGVIFFDDVCHQPEIVADQLFPGGGIPSPQGSKGGLLFPGGERFGETSAFQMERQKQKFCGKKLQQGQQHTISLPVYSC